MVGRKRGRLCNGRLVTGERREGRAICVVRGSVGSWVSSVNGWNGLRRECGGLEAMSGIVKGAVDGHDGLWDGGSGEIAVACATCGGRMEGEKQGGGGEGLSL